MRQRATSRHLIIQDKPFFGNRFRKSTGRRVKAIRALKPTPIKATIPMNCSPGYPESTREPKPTRVVNAAKATPLLTWNSPVSNGAVLRSEEHTSELQSQTNVVS